MHVLYISLHFAIIVFSAIQLSSCKCVVINSVQ